MNRLIKYQIVFFIFTIGFNTVFAQHDSCILITAEDFQGTLIQENYLIDISPDNSGSLKMEPIEFISGENIKKWTPTKKQVIEFENKLHEKLKKYKPKDEYEKSNLAYIIEELVHYKRQYIGYLNLKNKQCLWIKFYKSESVLIEPEYRIQQVFGGGADYFTLWFNLQQNEIEGLVINGPI